MSILRTVGRRSTGQLLIWPPCCRLCAPSLAGWRSGSRKFSHPGRARGSGQPPPKTPMNRCPARPLAGWLGGHRRICRRIALRRSSGQPVAMFRRKGAPAPPSAGWRSRAPAHFQSGPSSGSGQPLAETLKNRCPAWPLAGWLGGHRRISLTTAPWRSSGQPATEPYTQRGVPVRPLAGWRHRAPLGWRFRMGRSPGSGQPWHRPHMTRRPALFLAGFQGGRREFASRRASGWRLGCTTCR